MKNCRPALRPLIFPPSLLAAAISSLLLFFPFQLSADTARPNIVLMLADDLGWADVGYHGGEIDTPAIDQIAAQGVRMERFYATPICSPTRAALMTGRDPIKLGVAYDQIHPWYNAGLPDDEYLIAEALRDAGYQTAMVGKWHLGHTQQHQLPNAQGFEHFYGHLHTNTDFYRHQREGGHDLQRNGVSVDRRGEYLTHIEGEEAVRFIEQRDKDKPFFLYLPFTAPHSPMQAPQASIDKYSHLPQQGFRRTYAAMVDEMDRAVGNILVTLQQQGITDETLVVFVSDNGGSHAFGGSNVPLRGEKGQTFDGGVRVPAVMRWPQQLPAGAIVEQTLSIMDLYPSLLAAAGVDYSPPKPLDGENMWSSIRSGKQVERQQPLFFVSEIPVPGMIWTGVLEGDWKLIQLLREGQTSMSVRTMLFNLADDPYEKNNVAAAHADKVETLAEKLRLRRAQHPLAGTRGTLVAHPGWVAPRDWAASAQPSALLQDGWQSELPFSRELVEAVGDRGHLITDEELSALERQRAEREKNW